MRGDNLDLAALTAAMKGADFVFHLAANADIRDGWKHPAKDLQQNTVATFNVLEAMRANGVRRIAFSSTGSVYGEALVTPESPTPEDDAFPIQTSLYGASKMAGEGLISAYAEGAQLDEAYVFRFVSILGERYTHGHVFDFYQQLIAHPDHLRPVPVLAIKPSKDLGILASEQFHAFPRALRHLLRGVGASDRAGWDLLSYLAFEGEDHGFRQAANIIRSFEAELSFYGQIFGFTPADSIERLEIANLPA